MPIWDKAGKRPTYIAADKTKNVIATEKGWETRTHYTDNTGTLRTKGSVAVVITGLASEVTMGNPDIVELYVSNTTNGTTLKAGQTGYVNVVYTEALSIGAGATAMTLTIKNQTANTTVTATSSTDKADILNANNTISFEFTANAGVHLVEAQTLGGNTSTINVYSVLGGTTEKANTAISSAVSTKYGSFTVS